MRWLRLTALLFVGVLIAVSAYTGSRGDAAVALFMLILWGAVELGWGGGDPSKTEGGPGPGIGA